jgi:predicted DNA-binding protein
LAIREGVYTVDLPSEELLSLVQKGYMKGNQISHGAIDALETALKVVKKEEIKVAKANAEFPILTVDTGEIVKRLAKTFLANRCTNKEIERLSSYSKNPFMIPYMFMFLEMFPTADDKKNKNWNKHFSTTYTNVTLRRMTAGTSRKFQQIWKKKDIGLFLLGTYLCIKESYNEEKETYFVKNIENYLKEWEHWYNMAEDMLERGELEELTRRGQKKSASTNTVAL